MLEHPSHWQNHYRAGDRSMLHFSFADRCRYYWPDASVEQSVQSLFKAADVLNLSDDQWGEVFSAETIARAVGLAPSRSLALARANVQVALSPYFFGGADG